jgi:hypothetical protein
MAADFRVENPVVTKKFRALNLLQFTRHFCLIWPWQAQLPGNFMAVAMSEITQRYLFPPDRRSPGADSISRW